MADVEEPDMVRDTLRGDEEPATQFRLSNPPPLSCLDWELDSHYRHQQRILGLGDLRLDAAHLNFDRIALEASAPTRANRAAEPTQEPEATTQGRYSTGAWLVLSGGAMASVCGAVLLGWSHFGNRPDLWTPGVPIALVGQVGLLLGLVLQLERFWHSHAAATQKLRQVDNKLADLSQTTERLGTVHSTASRAFYAHLADGASPRVLLADLKGQLDILAVKLSEKS